ILLALALPGLAPQLAFATHTVKPAPQAAAKSYDGATALSLDLERDFRTNGYMNVTLHPEAIDDPLVLARLDRYEAALGAGLEKVLSMPPSYERTDKARALAGSALDLARIVWEAAF